MHRVPYDYVSLFLRHIGWEAERRGASVRDLLKEYAQGKIEETAAGMAVVGVAADGTSTSYALPAPSAGLTLSPESLSLMIGRLWDQIDELLETIPSPTDAQILAHLKTANKPIRTTRPGFHLMSPR